MNAGHLAADTTKALDKRAPSHGKRPRRYRLAPRGILRLRGSAAPLRMTKESPVYELHSEWLENEPSTPSPRPAVPPPHSPLNSLLTSKPSARLLGASRMPLPSLAPS